jgi:hypothetical protein
LFFCAKYIAFIDMVDMVYSPFTKTILRYI